MSRSQHQGAGLIEVAIAMLVIAMASLGLARTLLSTWESSVETVQRVEAIQGLEGMLEVMRSNWAALPEFQLTDGDPLESPSANCNQVSCSPGEWGRWNLWLWQQGLEWDEDNYGPWAVLLGPRLCIKPGPQRANTVITWGSRERGAAAPDCAMPLSSGGKLSLSMRAGMSS